MSQYDNTNRGVLFVNDRKETDKHPDWKGRLNINGVDHWVDGWAKQSARGELISLSLGKPCDQQGQQRPHAAPQRQQAPARPAPARPPQRPQAAPAPAPRQSSGFDDAESDDCPF
jgi:hypothetical protein